ncbi:MAG: glycosyltransferase [Bacteroidia bacterium]
MQPKSVLIITLKFGAGFGVGGRRWFIYGQELTKKGHQVHVLCEKNYSSKSEAGISQIHQFKKLYPHVLNISPRTILEKINYRISYFLVKLTTTGIIFDQANWSHARIHRHAANIIRQYDIKNVIVTGAPFSLFFIGLKLQKEFPNVNVITDFRDFWSQGFGYGIKGASKKRFANIQEQERFVIQNADTLTCPSVDIQKILEESGPKKAPVILPNPVEDRVITHDTEPVHKKKDIIITLIGSQGGNTEKYWENYFTALNQLQASGRYNFRSVFVGNSTHNFVERARNEKNLRIEFIANQPTEELYKLLGQSDFFLIFKNDVLPNSFPTKFLDYLNAKKPIFCYTVEGEVSREIRNNNLGFVCNDKTSPDEIGLFIDNYLSGIFKYNSNYENKKFSLEANISLLETLLR